MMKRYLYILLAAAVCLSLSLSCTKVGEPEESLQPEPLQPETEGLNSLTFLHENSDISVPMVSDPDGCLIEAKVRWGDASSVEVYSAGLKHSYGREGEYLVEIEGNGGSSVEFNDVYGISMVDFSRF